MSHLEISDVGITFPTPKGPFVALQNVNLRIERGEFIALIGHSGCGKSTLLNIIAGLNQATSGGVVLSGREVDAPGPDRAMVFQTHALLPWLSAYDNVRLAVDQVWRGVIGGGGGEEVADDEERSKRPVFGLDCRGLRY